MLADVGYQSNWFDVLQTDFMRNAFIGGTLVAIAAGLIGYFVVVRQHAFAAHALAHIGFPGATGAVLLGVPVTARPRGVLRRRRRSPSALLGKRVADREVATGTILAFATGLGVLFSSLATRSTSTVTSVLFGNLLAISTEQLVDLRALHRRPRRGARALVARPLLFASVDPRGGRGQGRARARCSASSSWSLLALVDHDGRAGGRARCCCSRSS